MKGFILFFAAMMILLFAGCDNNTCDNPAAPADTNHTNVDPPFIQSVDGPWEVVVGNEASYSCTILSDADIVRKSWDLDLFAADYFYPTTAAEGAFAPTGTRPNPFVESDTGATPTFAYSHRGKYTAALEIEDADGYIERSGTMTNVVPAVDDTPSIHIVRAASVDTLDGSDFDIVRFGLIADNAVPACVYSDGYDRFFAYCHIDNEIAPGYRIVHTKAETGKHLGIEGSGWFVAKITVDFDVEGAMHIWGDNPDDFVKYSTYMTLRYVDGLPITHYLYSKVLDNSAPEQGFYLKDNHVIEDTVTVMGNEEYEFWFGVETFQYLSPGDSAGSAICFDGVEAPTKLNKVTFELEK